MYKLYSILRANKIKHVFIFETSKVTCRLNFKHKKKKDFVEGYSHYADDMDDQACKEQAMFRAILKLPKKWRKLF